MSPRKPRKPQPGVPEPRVSVVTVHTPSRRSAKPPTAYPDSYDESCDGPHEPTPEPAEQEPLEWQPVELQEVQWGSGSTGAGTLPPDELPLRGDFAAPPAPAPLNLGADTLRALSVRQPWAELIVRGDKNLEYRTWRLREMGPLLIHASRTLDHENFEITGMEPQGLPFGALVGIVDVVDCVEVEDEPGLYAFQLAHPRRFAVPVPYRGAASIFRVPTAQVRAALPGEPQER